MFTTDAAFHPSIYWFANKLHGYYEKTENISDRNNMYAGQSGLIVDCSWQREEGAMNMYKHRPLDTNPAFENFSVVLLIMVVELSFGIEFCTAVS